MHRFTNWSKNRIARAILAMSLAALMPSITACAYGNNQDLVEASVEVTTAIETEAVTTQAQTEKETTAEETTAAETTALETTAEETTAEETTAAETTAAETTAQPTTQATTAAPTQATTQAPTQPPTEAPTQSGYVGLAGKTVYDYDWYLRYWGFSEDTLKLIDTVIGQITNDGMNREQKIYAVHEYIVSNVQYDYSDPYQYYSVDDTMNVHYTICQGYADTFYVFMTELGIPCHTLSGKAYNGHWGGHAWNAVQLENGEWYFIDTTWDDSKADVHQLKYYMATAEQIGTDHIMSYSRQNESLTTVESLGTLGTNTDYKCSREMERAENEVRGYDIPEEAVYYIYSEEDAAAAGTSAAMNGQYKIAFIYPNGLEDGYYIAFMQAYHDANPQNRTIDGLGSGRLYSVYAMEDFPS